VTHSLGKKRKEDGGTDRWGKEKEESKRKEAGKGKERT
jgi:hypothetical protein